MKTKDSVLRSQLYARVWGSVAQMLTGAAVLAASSCAALAESATLAADPGPRGGAAAAGGPIGG
ncbi:MAG TPA: hypothetical protein VEH77_15955, partial [Roseiarcus sp.]|nr:hypothetical protein [Roseiarcus sp.]